MSKRIEIPRLEIRAAEHCNLSCKGCSQLSPFQSVKFPDLSIIERSLAQLSQVLHARNVCVLGGEPLLNPELDILIELVRDADISGSISVLTNGLLLRNASVHFWSLIDEVEISIYPSTKRLLSRFLPELFDLAYQNSTWIRLLNTKEFQHIAVSSRIKPRELVQEIFHRCYFKDFTHTLHAGYFFRCAPSININLIDVNGVDPYKDGLFIHGGTEFEEELVEFLDRSAPLEACNFCVGSSGSAFDHTQLAPESLGKFENPFSSSKYVPKRNLK